MDGWKQDREQEGPERDVPGPEFEVEAGAVRDWPLEGADGSEDGDWDEAQHPASDEQWKAARLKKQRELDEAARRAAEEEAARRDGEIAERFGGVQNPLTGEPVLGHEALLALAEAADELPQRGGDAPRDAAHWERVLEGQVREISRLEPEIQRFEDLPKMANFEVFDALARRGVDLVSAYKAANFDELARRSAAAARQAALNRSRSARHLERSAGAAGVADMAEIPEEAAGVWREMFPDDSPEERRRKYNRTLEAGG